jgi:hypothetical protein
MKESKGQGFKDKVSYPPDNSGSHTLPDTKGGKMGGSTTNLSHSLSGSSAVQK